MNERGIIQYVSIVVPDLEKCRIDRSKDRRLGYFICTQAGKIRVVAVLGGARQAILPDVPTFAELGLAGFEDLPYYGIFAPAGTPKATIDKFSDALAKVLTQPDVKERLTAMGLTVGFMDQATLAKREQAYTKVWAKLIKDSGFVAQ